MYRIGKKRTRLASPERRWFYTNLENLEIVKTVKVEPKELPEELKKNPFYKLIWSSLQYEGRTTLVIIIGKRGKGKSLLAVKLAHDLDPAFKAVATNYDNSLTLLKQRVIMKPDMFLSVVNNATLSTGSAIIIDEAGITAPAREWWSFNNRAISQLVQIFRHKQFFTIFTVPSFNYVDVHLRTAFDYMIEALGWSKKTLLTKTKVMELEFDKITGDMINKYIRIREQGQPRRIKKFYFKRVPIQLTRAYIDYSNSFKTEFEHELEEGVKVEKQQRLIQATKQQQARPPPDIDKVVASVVNNYTDYLRSYKGETGIILNRIIGKQQVSSTVAYKVKDIAERKLREMGLLN